MTNPIGSFQTNFGRFYAHPAVSGGVDNPYDPYAPKPSITNIIGMLDKKFLPPYYAKLVAEYAVKNVDSIRYWVEKFGEDMAIGNLKAIPNRKHPNAAIGDNVHDCIDNFLNGREWTPDGTTALNMMAQFINFVQVAKPEFVRSEYTVWSYEHGYAGTGDLLLRIHEPLIDPGVTVTIPPGLWIVDTKTGTSVHSEVAMQTAAIQAADVILNPDGTESPMPLTDFLGVLHVRPRSVKLHQLARTEEAFKTFLGLKQTFDWVRFDYDQTILTPYKTVKTKEAK